MSTQALQGFTKTLFGIRFACGCKTFYSIIMPCSHEHQNGLVTKWRWINRRQSRQITQGEEQVQ